MDAYFIKLVKHLTSLANIIPVKKTSMIWTKHALKMSYHYQTWIYLYILPQGREYCHLWMAFADTTSSRWHQGMLRKLHSEHL